MSLLVILTSLLLYSGLHAVTVDETSGINVLATLEEKHKSCDLHDFVLSSDNKPESEYEALTDDLYSQCAETELNPVTRIICRMILIELEIGCSSPKKLRPAPVKYTYSSTATQICSTHKITYINKWIWQKFTEKEKEQLGLSWVELCQKITSSTTTLRLVRFFYKIAPRIRRADTHNSLISSNKTVSHLPDNELPLEKRSNRINKSVDQIEQNDSSVTVNETIAAKPKPLAVLDLKLHQSKSNITVKERPKKKQFLDNEDADEDGNIIDSGNLDGDLDNNKKVQNEHKHQKEHVDSKKENGVEVKPVDKHKNQGEIFPLGRAGEKPDREQNNERPKPKAIEIESVFKPNARERQNWVEGKQGDDQPRLGLGAKLNPFGRMKHGENPSNMLSKGKKRFSLRSRSNIYHDDDFDNWTNHFTTSTLVFVLLIVAIYILLHNRNKIIGFLIEGFQARRGTYGRRFGGNADFPRHTRLTQAS